MDNKPITVRNAAQLKGVSTQAVRDAVAKGLIDVVVDRSESGFAMLLSAESVAGWQPAIQAGWKRNSNPSRTPTTPREFVPIAKEKLPTELPSGRWFQVQKMVWVGIIRPATEKPTKPIPGFTILLETDEILVARYERPTKAKKETQ